MATLAEERWSDCDSMRDRVDVAVWLIVDLVVTAVREWRELLGPRSASRSLRTSTRFPDGARAIVSTTSSRLEKSSMLDRFMVLVRQTVRRLRLQWATSLLVVLTLSFGVGSTVAIYSYVHAALVRPLPFDEAHRVVQVWPEMTFSKKLLDRFRGEVDSYGAVAGYSGWVVTLTGAERSEELQAIAVGPGYFDVLGVTPILGRALVDSDSRAGAEGVVLLSYELWLNRFGSDPAVIDRLVDFGALDGDESTQERRRVVGVLPARHEPLVPEAKMWIPLTVDAGDEEDYSSSWYLSVVARLADDASVASASSELEVVSQRLKQTGYPNISRREQGAARVVSLRGWMVDGVQTPLLVLLAAVGIVLLIACANVASLLIARTASRQQELRLRSALGADRRRLLGELLFESGSLAVAGGALGLVFAQGVDRVISIYLPQAIPRLDRASLDLPVVAFALLLTMLVALLSGLPSALRAMRGKASLSVSMRAGSQRVDDRMQLCLVVAEVGLSVALLVGTGLVLKSFSQLIEVDPGFSTQDVTAIRVVPPSLKYEDDERWRQLGQALNEHLAAVPGVDTVGGIHLLPLSMNNWNFPYLADGQVLAEGQASPSANYRVVTGEYFRALRIPLLAGRVLTARDREGSEPVVVINETLAREFGGADQAVGKTLNLFMNEGHQVVGVVGDVRQHRLQLAIEPEMYYAINQRWPTGSLSFVLKSQRPSVDLYPALRDAVRTIDPAIAIGDMMPMDEAVGRSVAEQRFMSILMSAFGALAIVLSLVGVYGVMAYLATKRVREIGIRMALGAGRSRVLRDGLKGAAVWIAGGLAVGALASIAAGRMVGSLLFEVDAFDPSVLVVVLLGVAVSAGLASLIPLRKATRCDPARVLRAD